MRFKLPQAIVALSVVALSATMMTARGVAQSSDYWKLGQSDPGGQQAQLSAAPSIWTTAATNALIAPRRRQSAVWTGTEVIVWSGYNGTYLNDGWRYNPVLNNWTAVTTNSAPVGRINHTAIWTGTEMIVWGGSGALGNFTDGARYNPASNSWTAVNTNNSPGVRSDHTAVWTGSEMIIWGGDRNDGARYNPGSDTWTAVTTNGAPGQRMNNTAVWTGTEMIVWGGYYFDLNDFMYHYRNDGGRYNPVSNSWTGVSLSGAPSVRRLHTAVWTGSEMIVWGGTDAIGTAYNDGGRYSPTANTWVAVNMVNAPVGRSLHTAVWSGSEMIVWGGEGTTGILNSGGRFSPSLGTWTSVSLNNAPSAREYHTATWIGNEMFVWGGVGLSGYLNDGARYSAAADVPELSYVPLALSFSGTNCNISWVTTNLGLILQQATNLAPPTLWVDVGEITTTNGFTNTVQQGISSTVLKRYYRLRTP